MQKPNEIFHWGASAVGKVGPVAAVIERQFSDPSHVCSEPAETARQAARACIASVLATQAPGTIVDVTASGSASSVTRLHEVTIKIESLFPFEE